MRGTSDGHRGRQRQIRGMVIFGERGGSGLKTATHVLDHAEIANVFFFFPKTQKTLSQY
jgi:hypothetical protein